MWWWWDWFLANWSQPSNAVVDNRIIVLVFVVKAQDDVFLRGILGAILVRDGRYSTFDFNLLNVLEWFHRFVEFDWIA